MKKIYLIITILIYALISFSCDTATFEKILISGKKVYKTVRKIQNSPEGDYIIKNGEKYFTEKTDIETSRRIFKGSKN